MNVRVGTIRKAERWRIDAFELWCWRRLLRVPQTARRWNQSILKKSILNIHWKDWCWSWGSSILATWGEEPTHWERPWFRERLREGEEGDRGWDGWMSSLNQWTWVWTNQEMVEDRGALCAAVHGVTKSQTWLSDWTELTKGPDPLEMKIWIISSGKEPVLYIIMINIVNFISHN